MSKTVKIVIAVVIGVLLICGIGGAAAYYFTKNTPKNTYLLSEQETAKQMKAYGEDRFENEFEFQDKMKDESYLINLNASADVPEALLKSSDIPKSVADASKLGFKLGHDPDKEHSVIALTPTVADNEIGEFQWAADKQNQYYAAPILDDVYKAKNNELVDVYKKITGETSSVEGTNNGITNDSLNLNSLLSGTQISQDKIDEISKKYSEVITDKLDDDNFEKDDVTIKVNGEDKDVKKVTMNVSKGETKAILTDILEKAKKDKDIKAIAEDQFNAKDYKKQLDDILKEVKDTDKAEFPSVKSVIWEDDNQILKRNLTMKDEDGSTVKLNGTSQVDDDNLMIDYKLTTDDDQEVALKGKSTKKDDQYKDNYKVTFDNGYRKSDATLTNTESQDGDKRNDKGQIEINANYDKTTIDFNNKLDTDTKNNTQKQALSLSTDIDNETVVINIKGDTKLKEDIKFKKANAQDLNTMSDSDFRKLQREISNNTEDIVKDIAKDIKDKK
ncbi:DUF6583 family protein [Staphylococcus saprophyticus]|uniref:DUF6583 family protein n=1 Tax=Staphylococcus saprophyticus TaxID=29385 RepID=UPI000853263C|nr:DUF6583 family protein [Staphylococcus saprophyticus]MDW3870759.1 hypothetical protein [Staphylococcus saprophyticus]MDW4475983.1 hypothetical protein [Staphylococcus saprophyticus]OEK09903.1 hypothetical protein ASS78_01420 [Staphylococcus saprophyticus]WQL48183.1 DUF6583 family protein [Staphylococcus saprophyticus]